MTDELAGMPQSMLREVVLRLICPDEVPPIDWGSNIEHVSRWTTQLMQSAGGGLSRSPQALDLLNRFGAQAPLLDEIAGLFLTVAETPGPLDDLINPYCISGGFEEMLYTYEVVKLGASAATMERLMAQLVRGGWHRQAEDIAGRLGRQLTRAEVFRLAHSYTRGAVQSRQSDEFWPQFVRRHLDDAAAAEIRDEIYQRNQRWANDIF